MGRLSLRALSNLLPRPISYSGNAEEELQSVRSRCRSKN
jgi:hypothetical protein